VLQAGDYFYNKVVVLDNLYGVEIVGAGRTATRLTVTGFDVRVMSWGDGSGVPNSGKNLVVVGTDNNDLLHIRIFDSEGNRSRDTDETQLPAQAAAIATLKQQLPGLLFPYELTHAEKAQVVVEATSIVGQTPVTVTGCGSAISALSANTCAVRHLTFHCVPEFKGDFINCDWSTANADVAWFVAEDCVFGKNDNPLCSPRSWIRFNRTIISNVRDCGFLYGTYAIINGDGNYGVAITVERCSFNYQSTIAIYTSGRPNTSTESARYLNNTFEPLYGFNLRLMSWGDGTGVPTSCNDPSCNDLVIVGIDNSNLLHIRIFDAFGNRVTDTDETKLPAAQAAAVAALKQQIPGLLPPHVLTADETTRVICEATSIVGQPPLCNNGKANGILQSRPIDPTKYSNYGTLIQGNWFGDVSVAGGTYITVANLLGGAIINNWCYDLLDNDVHVIVLECEGLLISGNRFQQGACGVSFPGPAYGYGVAIIGNAFQITIYELRLMSWGDGSGVQTQGSELVIVGTDNKGLLHIRIFDAHGNLVTDTDETKLPGTQAEAISILKQELLNWLALPVLTGALKALVLSEVSSIIGQTLRFSAIDSTHIATGFQCGNGGFHQLDIYNSGRYSFGIDDDGNLLLDLQKPDISGSQANGTALNNLLAALATLGLINNITTADAGTIASSQQAGDYTFELTDMDTVVEYTGASAATFTIPVRSSSADFPVWRDPQLMSWGDGSSVPKSGQSLLIAGTDGAGLLHIRTFDTAGVRTDTYEAMEGDTLHLVSADASGNVLSDSPESSLSAARSQAIATLKNQLPGLKLPHVLSGVEKDVVRSEATLIIGHLPVGAVIEVCQMCAGRVTIAGADGVKLLSVGSKVHTAAQYATIKLRQRTSNVWVLSGDLA
jgi:hypothetical protein